MIIVHWEHNIDTGQLQSCTVEKKGVEIVMHEWESLYYDPAVENAINSYLSLKEVLRYKSQGYKITIRRHDE